MLFVACVPKENRYSLSEERLFGIANLDEIVEKIRNDLKLRSSSISISFSFKGDYMDDISPFVKELMELVLTETGEPDEGDYIRYELGGYTFSYGHEATSRGYNYSIIINPEYYSTGEQERQVTEKVREILDSFPLRESSSDYEKVRAVYDYLTANVKYDIVHKKNQYHTLKSTAYGALINRTATCQGISVAAYRLLMELGVSCRVITGMANPDHEDSEYHAWNIVCIDGLYYNLDITWDEQLGGEDYFLKSDENFAGHARDEEFKTAEFYDIYPMAEQDYIL